MSRIFQILLFGSLLLISLSVYAEGGEEPIISNNVHVMQNTTSSQCPSSWKGRVYPDAMQVLTGAGEEYTQTGPIVRACSQCSFDNQSRDCVCATCYDYYD